MSEHILDDRIRRAYVTAMEASRDRRGARVDIHIGTAVRDYLRTLSANVIRQDFWDDIGVTVQPKLFGLPVIVDEGADPTSVEVRSVWAIQ